MFMKNNCMHALQSEREHWVLTSTINASSENKKSMFYCSTTYLSFWLIGATRAPAHFPALTLQTVARGRRMMNCTGFRRTWAVPAWSQFTWPLQRQGSIQEWHGNSNECTKEACQSIMIQCQNQSRSTVECMFRQSTWRCSRHCAPRRHGVVRDLDMNLTYVEFNWCHWTLIEHELNINHSIGYHWTWIEH